MDKKDTVGMEESPKSSREWSSGESTVLLRLTVKREVKLSLILAVLLSSKSVCDAPGWRPRRGSSRRRSVGGRRSSVLWLSRRQVSGPAIRFPRTGLVGSH